MRQIMYYLVPCSLSTDPKIHDLEWPWMAILRLIFTITNSPFTYLRQSLFTHVTSGDLRMCGHGPWSAEFWSPLRIFRRCYIVGTLTNKANISTYYHLVPYRLSTRDLERPWMAILRWILFCAGICGSLKPGFRSLANLTLLVNVVGEL